MIVGVDVGGTFTDLVALDPVQGTVSVGKSLNSGHGPGEGVLNAIASAGVDPPAVEQMIHGTTVVTNILVERDGASIGLLCSTGFRDVLEIQLSWRQRTFDLSYDKLPSLIPRDLRLEVAGRIDADGTEVEPLDEVAVAAAIRDLADRGVDVVAVALYNAYASDAHERRVAEIAAEVAPGLPVTLATDVDARMGEYERTSTVALNGMAVPRFTQYVDDLAASLKVPTLYMQSAGGVLPVAEARERPIQLAFSGPAAGVLAAREVARELGSRNVITMDMGGTSCDVALIWDGELRTREQIDIDWGIPARVRTLDVQTVGAGGGSVAWRDPGGALRVGPRSAGALPGPACYGRGGIEPTVTDANVALGIIAPLGLLGGDLPLQEEAALTALEGLGEEFGVSALDAARAIHTMVSANMAQAVREITVQRGIDPRDCVLVAFGGAGAQHAAAVAAELAIKDVVVPRNASVLSAVGLLTANLEVTAARTVLKPIDFMDSDEGELVFEALSRNTRDRLEGAASGEIREQRHGGLRYAGQSHEIAMPLGADAATTVARFHEEHERLFGTRRDAPVEIVDLWVTLTAVQQRREAVFGTSSADGGDGASPVAGHRHVALADDEIPVYDRAALRRPVNGPCLIEETNSVTYVPPAAVAHVRHGHLVLSLSA